jgi:hypothetical protein
MGAVIRPWLLALALFGCASASSGAAPTTPAEAPKPPGIRFEGGDGLTCERRVEILGTEDERAGVAAEQDWLKQHYPDHKLLGQSLGDCRGHTTDKVLIRTSDGKTLTIHFDISAFFGKAFKP